MLDLMETNKNDERIDAFFRGLRDVVDQIRDAVNSDEEFIDFTTCSESRSDTDGVAARHDREAGELNSRHEREDEELHDRHAREFAELERRHERERRRANR